jgi:hypothetical protein
MEGTFQLELWHICMYSHYTCRGSCLLTKFQPFSSIIPPGMSLMTLIRTPLVYNAEKCPLCFNFLSPVFTCRQYEHYVPIRWPVQVPTRMEWHRQVNTTCLELSSQNVIHWRTATNDDYAKKVNPANTKTGGEASCINCNGPSPSPSPSIHTLVNTDFPPPQFARTTTGA